MERLLVEVSENLRRSEGERRDRDVAQGKFHSIREHCLDILRGTGENKPYLGRLRSIFSASLNGYIGGARKIADCSIQASETITTE